MATIWNLLSLINFVLAHPISSIIVMVISFYLLRKILLKTEFLIDQILDLIVIFPINATKFLGKNIWNLFISLFKSQDKAPNS
ncbi:hypothetical protein NOS3756_42680 [Nostoc sp. NIES-3756]|jgi:hypothetical protein|nr:hypothetical protein NOS3756_42680 [Nostoc sp. NIES-3756]